MNGIGWLGAIIIGGLAGWLAEKVMKSNTGLLMNIVLGIVGSIVFSAILQSFGFFGRGWIAFLVTGFIGACLLIYLARLLRR
ncbi:GlsB/YeaQ/YmgE family stress response membrane protein [Oricola sp.]|uniref:GlsB/YeaQ/YmgE family stress response membrane protein n=1 Tax=Oricola sp. TaxID=1979950 RepID=UPI00351524B0